MGFLGVSRPRPKLLAREQQSEAISLQHPQSARVTLLHSKKGRLKETIGERRHQDGREHLKAPFRISSDESALAVATLAGALRLVLDQLAGRSLPLIKFVLQLSNKDRSMLDV